MGTKELVRSAAMMFLVATLTSCATYSIIGGNQSVLTGEAVAMRTVFVTIAPLARRPAYLPAASCRYQQESFRGGRSSGASIAKLEVKAVRDRLFLTWKDSGPDSTALIGRDGKLFDFNYASTLDGERWTSENFSQKSADLLRQYGPEAHTLNQVELLFPRLVTRGYAPGSTLGSIHDETGVVWGEYIYRGMATVKGNRGILADLVRRDPGDGRMYSFGYSVFDEATFAPLVVVYGTGNRSPTGISSIHIWRLGCP